ncbi:MAG: hypothetical protein M1832_001236 [Thelocarpon impressellum]|nr:MAG: hypothetical protein M1832_001236 [Thelocarpon impressellum]
MASSLPHNISVSTHPCLAAKLSQLRSASTNARDTKALVHEIALIVGCEALGASLKLHDGPEDKSPLGYTYTTQTITPSEISLVPILRSGLGMVDALQTLLPAPVPVHHLGLFRDPTTLQPVEYYNNLPFHHAPSTNEAGGAADLAIILDPIIATGGTAVAAIQTLREAGVGRVLLLAVLGSVEGVRRAAEEWAEGVGVWVGGLDEGGLDERGMIKPGVGDVGDRLFLTVGK